jgi:hypothetical protein
MSSQIRENYSFHSVSDISPKMTKSNQILVDSSDKSSSKGKLVRPKSKTLQYFQNWSPTTLKILVFLAYYVVGVIYYHHTEGWKILDCVYYITVTVTTVGATLALSLSYIPLIISCES